MKKVVYFIPLIGYVSLTIFLRIVGFFESSTELLRALLISPVFFLFLLSAIFLAKGRWWGGILGALPGVGSIYAYYDNVINHMGKTNLVGGVLVILFHAICMKFVISATRKSKKRNKTTPC